jgi:hypothetical protein
VIGWYWPPHIPPFTEQLDWGAVDLLDSTAEDDYPAFALDDCVSFTTIHSRGSDGRCPICGPPNPCTSVLVSERDQREDDRLRVNMVDQFEQAVVPARTDEARARAERLARAREADGAPRSLVWMMRDGVYDEFSSRHTNPDGANLIKTAERYGLWTMARRARAGEFNAP